MIRSWGLCDRNYIPFKTSDYLLFIINVFKPNPCDIPLVTCYKNQHDDVIKWNHFAFLALCAGHRWIPFAVTRSFDVFFDLRISGWISNHEAGEWIRHCVHYGVTVMRYFAPLPFPVCMNDETVSRIKLMNPAAMIRYGYLLTIYKRCIKWCTTTIILYIDSDHAENLYTVYVRWKPYFYGRQMWRLCIS